MAWGRCYSFDTSLSSFHSLCRCWTDTLLKSQVHAVVYHLLFYAIVLNVCWLAVRGSVFAPLSWRHVNNQIKLYLPQATYIIQGVNVSITRIPLTRTESEIWDDKKCLCMEKNLFIEITKKNRWKINDIVACILHQDKKNTRINDTRIFFCLHF